MRVLSPNNYMWRRAVGLSLEPREAPSPHSGRCTTSRLATDTFELDPHRPARTPVVMATRTRKAEAQLLYDRINILSRCTVGTSPADQVFRTVSSILTLVRVSTRFAPIYEPPLMVQQDKMIDDKDSVQLSEYCFNVCGVVKTAIQGKNAGDLNESVRMALALGHLGRCVDLPWIYLLHPYQATLGLCATSSGLSEEGPACHASNTTRPRLRGTSWRSKRSSALSTH